jgi:3-deoxy-manno-octulosonate cytidylyltransferase (CMP-KDO synthetase)
MKKQKIIGIIPARYHSKRLEKKLLIKVFGKTILQHTFEKVKSCKLLDEIYIATDNEKILSHAKEISANPLLTPPCNNGTTRIIRALKENGLKADIVVNIQGDTPCILPSTIESMVEILKKDNKASMSTAATLIENKEDILSPHTVKVVFDEFKNALYFSRNPIPFSKDLDKTNYYHHIGVYAYKTDFLKILSRLKPSYLQEKEDLEQLMVLERGYKIKVAITKEHPLDINTYFFFRKRPSFRIYC